MDDTIRRALTRGHLIEITTTGRRTGLPRRIAVVFHVIGGRVYIAGMASSRKRAWLANLEDEPRMTFHLKGSARADLDAVARPIDDEVERRSLFGEIVKSWTSQDLETMVALSPLVEVTFPPSAA